MNRWECVLQGVEKRINKHSFRTWFRPTRLIRALDGHLTVRVPNQLFLEWIQSNYRTIVDEVIAGMESDIRSVSFTCAGTDPDTTVPDGGAGMDTEARGPAATPCRPSRRTITPRYTFQNFVVSSCNQFAHAAARAVAEKPSHAYNPLYIYGGVGLGKTHLLHAIGNVIKNEDPSSVILYISSENFMNELINAIRFEKTFEFKEKYRNVDVLLMDDIQFLEGKERTQEEFFHTFNQLYELQKQIVISSDCRPREISTLEERLRSRFEWGLIADIQPPDLETKVAILNKKAADEGVTLPQDVSLYVASKVKSNIRELEGCLVRTIAYASLTGRPIDLELTTETLHDIVSEAAHAITVETIQKLVAGFYRLKTSDLRSRNNSKNVALPRHVAMYLSKSMTHCSLPEIGRRFGKKHHSTVLHAIRKVERLRAEPEFDRQMQSFIEALQ
ncbi:MAG: chromosomal replication initiator protein DnaA [Acidobacteriota bacterium]